MSDKIKKAPLWAEKFPIVKESDKDDLDREAAIGEFRKGQPRQVAESEAYNKYKQDQHKKAAAYHTKGLLIAKASGDKAGIVGHGRSLYMHISQMNDKENAAQKIKALVDEDPSNNGTYKFKAHPADNLLGDALENASDKSTDKEGEKLGKSESLDYLKQNLAKSLKDLLKIWDPVPKRPGAGGTGGYEYRPGSIQSGKPELKLGNLTEAGRTIGLHPSHNSKNDPTANRFQHVANDLNGQEGEPMRYDKYHHWHGQLPWEYTNIGNGYSMRPGNIMGQGKYTVNHANYRNPQEIWVQKDNPSHIAPNDNFDPFVQRMMQEHHAKNYQRYMNGEQNAPKLPPASERFKHIANEINGDGPNDKVDPNEPTPFDTWSPPMDAPAQSLGQGYTIQPKEHGTLKTPYYNVSNGQHNPDFGRPLDYHGFLNIKNPHMLDFPHDEYPELPQQVRDAANRYHSTIFNKWQNSQNPKPANRPIELE